MADIQPILDKAKALGEALAAHPQVQSYVQAQQAVRSDQEAQQLLQQYQARAAEIQQKEAQGQAVEVDEKKQLKDIEAQMAGRDSLKGLMRSQTEYVNLMNQVNRAIDEPVVRLGQPEKPE